MNLSPLLSSLNPEQRSAVLDKQKRLLVLAGAGAGKTKTLIHKILHLVFEQHVEPSAILAITFTRNAANEMVDRLVVHADTTGQYAALLNDRTLTAEEKDKARREYKRQHNWIAALTVGTFHGFGYQVLRSHVAKYYDNRFKIINEGIEEDLRVGDARETPDLVLQQVIHELCTDVNFLWKLKRYILDHYVDTKRTRKERKHLSHDGLIYTTLNGDLVRSKSERMIADWLYRHGIKYEYEKVVNGPDFSFKPDFYIPEANLYLEHISNRSYDPEHKDEQFRKAGFTCVKTFEQDTEDINHFHRVLEDHLRGRLNRPLTEGDTDIRFQEEFKDCTEDLAEFRRQLRSVMDKVKVNGSSFEAVFSKGKADKHDRIATFYELAEPIFKLYDRFCEQRSYLDFNDILIHFLKVLDTDADVRGKFQERFKYILVDEYQDVNNLQVQVVDRLLTPNTQLFCVGDDWQSIYGFRGSEVEHIVRFKDRYPEAHVLPFTLNYRSSSTIVGASNAVITRNKRKLEKQVSSVNPGGRKIQVYAADREEFDGVDRVVKTIRELYAKGFGKDDILVLFRRTKAVKPYRDRFYQEGLKVTTRTVHSAKGLEARVVFIVGLTERYFPNVWEGDRIYQMIKEDNISHLLEEERRLFYVAVTRAKEALYLVTEIGDESRFIKEMEERYLDRQNFVTISYEGDAVSCLSCGQKLERFFRYCPVCGTDVKGESKKEERSSTPAKAVARMDEEPMPPAPHLDTHPVQRSVHPAFERSPYNTMSSTELESFKNAVKSIPMRWKTDHSPVIMAARVHTPRSHEPWSAEENAILAQVLERTNDIKVLKQIFRRSASALKAQAAKLL